MEEKICVIGLGYVGLPVAVAFAKSFEVTGFDINELRIDELNNGIDRTNEVSASELKSVKMNFTSSLSEIKSSDFYIIAVPTPVDNFNVPDFNLVIKASESVAKCLAPRDTVVFESTVYPGATEEICIPILEKISGLKAGKDFHVGYSPERINPGDKEHRFETILKVVSGLTEEGLKKISKVYKKVVLAGVFEASTIKVAEAAKVIENTQRDINIAFMNELSLLFDKLDINTKDVLEAAGTKWNFLKFSPGLVGGHCIGVDPYYLTHKAKSVNYTPEMILAGRKINDEYPMEMARILIREINNKSESYSGDSSRVINVIGCTFKENCPDLRNSKVKSLIQELLDFGYKVNVWDAEADFAELKKLYSHVNCFKTWQEMPKCVATVFAVSHSKNPTLQEYANYLNESSLSVSFVFDIKRTFSKNEILESGLEVIQV